MNSRERFNTVTTARQSRNQKAGKPILAGISADNVFARRATNLTISSTENTDSTEKREGGELKSGPTQEYLPLIALGG